MGQAERALEKKSTWIAFDQPWQAMTGGSWHVAEPCEDLPMQAVRWAHSGRVEACADENAARPERWFGSMLQTTFQVKGNIKR